jgi:hypothetical protein
MRRLTVAERRARIGVRHHLAGSSRADDAVDLAEDLVGLHATDPATVFLSAASRLRRPDDAVGALERALYEERTLVRTLGMRRTMFVMPSDLVPVVQAACTDPLVPRERGRVVAMIEGAGLAADGASWLRTVEDKTLAALDDLGEATASTLVKAVPELATQFSVGEGKTWAGKVGLSTRVLFLLATEQQVARGRPEGGWTSSRYRWSLMRDWLPRAPEPVPPAVARAELARRWLAAFGPATADDLRWWTGWSVSQTRAALADVDAIEVAMDDTTGYALADDAEPTAKSEPWVGLLPSLDPTTMGWQRRDWYLGGHGPELFDRNGNAGPTVWADGRIVGGWAQRRDGEVVTELLEDVGREITVAIADAAEELRGWLGETRITPRFPTPLHQRLVR